MSENLVTLYAKQYASNIELLAQRMSVLQDTVTVGAHNGDKASPVDQVGSLEMKQVTDRFAAITPQAAPTARRWVVPTAWDCAQLVDKFDKLKMMKDPDSALVQTAALAKARKWDDLIINAFFSAAYTGAEGTATTAFTAGNVVGVAHGAAAATGLTVAKLRKAKQLAIANHYNPQFEQLYCVINSIQHDNLLAEAQVTSLDFNDKPVLVDGLVTRFLGINFKICEGLQTGTDDAAGTSRAVPVYTKGGMHLGKWDDPEPDVSQRKDLKLHPWQIYQQMIGGATRTDETKVFKIWCRE
ncbi:MAG: hypothetical protein DCC73_11410 [Proteobacteria bacterium]|nr:MAG: hypothetical protein DCC73_11410 [Pseudomonadota bacterium]